MSKLVGCCGTGELTVLVTAGVCILQQPVIKGKVYELNVFGLLLSWLWVEVDRLIFHVAPFFLPSWTLPPLLGAESLFFATLSHQSQFDLRFSCISAGKSLSQDCRSSKFHDPRAPPPCTLELGPSWHSEQLWCLGQLERCGFSTASEFPEVLRLCPHE